MLDFDFTTIITAVVSLIGGGWLFNLYSAKPRKTSIELENVGKAMEEMRNSASEEKAISIAKNLLQIGSLTYEQIAKATELTLAKVQELAGQLAG